MKTQEIIKTLRRMAVNTGTLNCLGCGYEHNCGVHGCRVLREAADRLDGSSGKMMHSFGRRWITERSRV